MMMSEPGKRGPGRPRRTSPELQRQQILRTAQDAFTDRGYAGTTMDWIAQSCRISKRTIYEHFRNKLDLFAAVVDMHRHQLLNLPEPDPALPLEAALMQVFRLDIPQDEDARRIAFLEVALLDAYAHPELAEVVRTCGASRARHELGGWLAARMQAGQIRSADPDHLAGILLDMVFGAVTSEIAGRDGPRDTDRIRHVETCISLFLNGARA